MTLNDILRIITYILAFAVFVLAFVIIPRKK